jgi:hypothetical protein
MSTFLPPLELRLHKIANSQMPSTSTTTIIDYCRTCLFDVQNIQTSQCTPTLTRRVSTPIANNTVDFDVAKLRQRRQSAIIRPLIQLQKPTLERQDATSVLPILSVTSNESERCLFSSFNSLLPIITFTIYARLCTGALIVGVQFRLSISISM